MGFTLTSDDSEWLTAIASFPVTETNPALGIYTDLIGAQGGPDGGVLTPLSPVWSQAFGLGSYTIDPFAAVGAQNDGTIRVLVERFSDDPRTCGNCFLGTAEFDVPFAVTVSPVPEPGAVVLIRSAWRRLDGSRDAASYRRRSIMYRMISYV